MLTMPSRTSFAISTARDPVPLALLRTPHTASKLSTCAIPPLARGRTWSTSSCRMEYAHRNKCRHLPALSIRQSDTVRAA